ncbi:MAG: histidine phosphotransferase family protein [Pseudomonadota bacterium]
MQRDVHLELALVELISSRICHDLVGPVGAVNAGAELMGEAGVSDSEALELMRKSGMEAARRLQLFRLAFGRGGNNVDGPTVRDALRQVFDAEGKVTLEWRNPGAVDAATARVILNMVMIVRDGLPFGGAITVTGDSGEAIHVNATGKRAGFRPEVLKVLDGAGDRDDLDPRNVQVFFTRILIERLGGHLGYRHENESIALIHA